MRRKAIAIVAVAALCLTFEGSASATSASAGAPCRTPGATFPANTKPRLICAGSASFALWVKVPILPKTRSAALGAAVASLARVQGFDAAMYVVDPAVQSMIQTNAAQMAATRTDLSGRAATHAGLATKYSAEAGQRNAELASLKQKDADLNAAMESARKAYEPLRAELDAMYPAYSAAYQARQEYISCLILKDFGFYAGSCGSAVVDEMNRQTTIAYNAKNAQVQAALTAWRAAIDAYSANLTLENAAQQSFDIASALSDLSTQNAGVLKAALDGLDADTEKNAQAIAAVTQLPSMVREHAELVKRAAAAVSGLKKSSDRTWPSLYVAAVTAQQAALAHLKRLDGMRGALAQEPWVNPASVSAAWLPATFFKASQSSNIKRPEGLDFGWKWSGDSGCDGKPCSVPLVAVSRDCLGAVVTMEYRTSAGVVEATSASAPMDLRAGAVSPVVVASKYSTTAKSGYLVQVTCASVGNPPQPL